jgi:hypothetical protein
MDTEKKKRGFQDSEKNSDSFQGAPYKKFFSGGLGALAQHQGALT